MIFVPAFRSLVALLRAAPIRRTPVWPGALRLLGRILVLMQFMVASAMAQDAPLTDAAVKAAFLYKFTGYIELPPSASPRTAFVIGVAQADEVAAELLRITAGRTVNNRPIEIRQIRDADGVAGLQMLFVGGTDPSRLARYLRAAQQRSVLSVTDAEDALELGSVINFLLVESRVRFEVSIPNADRNAIRLSSRMLTVAQRVEKGGQ